MGTNNTQGYNWCMPSLDFSLPEHKRRASGRIQCASQTCFKQALFRINMEKPWCHIHERSVPRD